MSQPLPPWSLHWSSNGELSPMDRQDLFLCLHLPGIAPFHQGLGCTGAAARQGPPLASAEDLPFPHR